MRKPSRLYAAKVHTPEEIVGIREACKVCFCSPSSARSDLTADLPPTTFVYLQLTRKVLNLAAAAIRVGVTTDEIDAIVHQETLKRDAYRSSHPSGLAT